MLTKKELKEHAIKWAERDFEEGIVLKDNYKDETELEEHLICYENDVTTEDVEYFKKEYKKSYNTIQYVNGMKEYLEFNKIINCELCEDVGVKYQDILNELDRQNIKYRIENYPENGQIKSLQPMCIYCEEFYIEEEN